MFDLDVGKLFLFGVVALLMVGPKELPAALRLAGRTLATLRRFRSDTQKAVETLISDASLDREISTLADMTRVNLALNPATAMRGNLPAPIASVAAVQTEAGTVEYASPEMRAYLAPPSDAPSVQPESAPLMS